MKPSFLLPAGFAELSVVTNAPPTGGYVDASPRAGSAAVDMFSLQSLEWTDDVDDLPLLYFFAYTNNQVSFFLQISGHPSRIHPRLAHYSITTISKVASMFVST